VPPWPAARTASPASRSICSRSAALTSRPCKSLVSIACASTTRRADASSIAIVLAGPCIGQLCGPVAREIAAGNPWITPDRYRGIRGLYGSYDSISPQTFRIFSTALSLGTTGQWRANDRFVVQGSALAGIGYAAVGTVHGGTERDHHYGTTPQALLALRLIDGDRTALDMTAREYFVTRASSNGPGGHDNIARAEISLTHRLHNLHTITVASLWNRRKASCPGVEDARQTRGTVGIFYTLLGQDRFGTVDWR
jgi:hypothetical protein